MTGLHKRFSGGRKCRWSLWENDSYSVMNTLVDIDCLAQYEPYHISRKRGKGARNGV